MDVHAWAWGRLDRGARARLRHERDLALARLAAADDCVPSSMRRELGLPSPRRMRALAAEMARIAA
jgi:hypothetical protein